MELGVLERIGLLGLLPQEGDITTLRIVRELREELSFDEEEHEALAFTQTEQGVTWNKDADEPKEIAIGPRATAVIVEALTKADRAKKLRIDHVCLWERFMSEDDPAVLAGRAKGENNGN